MSTNKEIDERQRRASPTYDPQMDEVEELFSKICEIVIPLEEKFEVKYVEIEYDKNEIESDCCLNCLYRSCPLITAMMRRQCNSLFDFKRTKCNKHRRVGNTSRRNIVRHEIVSNFWL